MARLALTIAGGIIGAILIPGVGASLGFALGSLAGGIIGQLAFPGKGTHTYGPRVNDMQVTNSTPGQVIPLIWGSMRVGGQVFWSGGIAETATTTSQSAKGGPSVSQTTYSYTISIAIGFCQGIAFISRIWGDAKLIYNGGASSGTNRGTYNSSTSYNANDIVQYNSDQSNPNATPNWYICMVPNSGQPPTNGSYWAEDLVDESTAQSKYQPPTLYTGTETQLADPTIVSAEGATVTPAYRGLCYAVWENFPLADFGNRLPNMRAEVTANFDNAYPARIIPWTDLTAQPYYITTDALNQTAFVYNGLNSGGASVETGSIARIDLATNTVVAKGNMNMLGFQMASLDPSTGPSFKLTFGTSDLYPGYTGDLVVDANGYLWGLGTCGNRCALFQLDPWTFNPIFAYDLHQYAIVDGDTVLEEGVCHFGWALQSVVLPNGAQYLVGIGGDASEFGIMFCMSYGVGSASLVGQYYGFGDVNISQICPVVDASGNVYFVQEPNVINGDCTITCINILSGVVLPKADGGTVAPGPIFTTVTNKTFPGSSSMGVIRGLLYCPIDDTLVAVTNVGAFLKLSVGSMGIIDQVGSASDPQFGIFPGTHYYNNIIGAANAGIRFDGTQIGGPGNIVQQAFKGQVQNGIIPVPSLSSDGAGGNNLLVNAVTFSVVSKFSFASFSVSGTPNTPDWPEQGAGGGTLCYDPSTNTLLCTTSAGGGGTPGYPFNVYRLLLDRINSNGNTADEIVSDICLLAGLTSDQIDTSALVGILVQGYPVTSLQAGKDMINNLGQAFFFEGRETDFKLQFVPRGQSPVATIPEADLGWLQDNAELTETIDQEQNVPKSIEVMYIDPNQDFQQGQQKKIRHSKTKKTVNQTSISLPIVMNAMQAAQLAQKLLWTAEDERRTYAINFWKAYYVLFDPCDVVLFDYHGVQLQARFTQSTIGQNIAIQAQLTSEDQNSYISVATGTNGGFSGQVLQGAAATILWLLDIPLLQDTDADGTGNMGYYIAMAPASNGKWNAGALYNSSDNSNFNQIDALTNSITYGLAQTILPAPADEYACWDETSTLTVRVVNGDAPSSTTQLAVLNGANAAVLYPSLEVIQFTTVTTNGDGTITLSGLLRGRRGTEWACGLHRVGETVFFPSVQGGIKHEQVGLTILNLVRYFKGVTVGMTVSSVASVQFTNTGRDLKPYAPAFAKVTSVMGGLQLSWIRRTRLGGGWFDGIGFVPLAEDFEQYSIDIVNPSGTVVDTINNIIPPAGVTDAWVTPLPYPNYLYTTAKQTADGYTPGAGWTAVVYQISGEVGRGFGKVINLP